MVIESLSQQDPQPIGEMLTRLREEKGYTIADVSDYLRVGQAYIEAIESNDINRFPERVYLLGFVRSYAKFLDQDPEYFAQRLKEEILGEQETPALIFPTTLTSDSSPSKKVLLFSSGTLIAILLIGFSAWQWHSTSPSNFEMSSTNDTLLQTSSRDETQNPLFNESLAEEEAREEDSSKENKTFELSTASSISSSQEKTLLKETPPVVSTPSEPPLKAAEAEQKPVLNNIIHLKFIEPCWIEIKDKLGKILVSKTFQSGEEYKILEPDLHGYTLHTGNAGGMLISTNNLSDKVLGRKGQLLTNLSLDSQTLSAYLSQH